MSRIPIEMWSSKYRIHFWFAITISSIMCNTFRSYI